VDTAEGAARRLPFPDPLDVPFDLIPSDLVEEISGRVTHGVQGSFTADDGERAPASSTSVAVLYHS